MAQYAVLMYAPVRDVDEAPSAAALEPYDRHAEEVRRAGAMVAAFALEPATTATSLRGDVVTDGPFIETKEVVVGVYVIQAPHLDAALEIVRRNPILGDGGGVEVRPVAGSEVHPITEG
jgi:hypothetical protein